MIVNRLFHFFGRCLKIFFNRVLAFGKISWWGLGGGLGDSLRAFSKHPTESSCKFTTHYLLAPPRRSAILTLSKTEGSESMPNQTPPKTLRDIVDSIANARGVTLYRESI